MKRPEKIMTDTDDQLNMDFKKPVKMVPVHGEYPAGSGRRRPHLSEHFPRVTEETLILVKVGHLPQH